MSQCNRCGDEITWKRPFTQGDRPLNLDNSVHSCKKPEAEAPKESKPAQASTPNTILAECIEFSETFKDLTDAKYDATARIYISGRMTRR